MLSNILVTGSVAFDFIMDFPGTFADNIDPKKVHILNISFLVNTLKKEKGGTAGNIAYSLALLKTNPLIQAAVGDDFDEYLQYLRSSGVDTSQIKVISSESTSSAFITTDLKDNQIAAFYPGAMKYNKNFKIKSLPRKPIFVVISPNDPKAFMNFTKQSKVLKIPYMFDPGMQLPRLTNKDLKQGLTGAEILIGNDYEIGMLKKRLSISTKEILNSVKVLITTLGSKGSMIETNNGKIIILAAKPRKVVDPTGAGDGFRAGFITGYLKGLNLQTCGQMGSISSCYVVEKYGTTNHTFSLAQFCKRYKDNFGEDLKI